MSFFDVVCVGSPVITILHFNHNHNSSVPKKSTNKYAKKLLEY